MEVFDVVVIGGGPAGSTAARYLAAGGCRVALVERNLKNRKPCGGAIPSTAFKEFNIGEDAVVRKTDSLTLFSPSGRQISLKMFDGTINIVDRLFFDQYLRDSACNEGVDLVHGEFRRISDSGRQYLTEIRRENGDILTIRSDYVIGCDGVNSPVRRAMGLPPVKYVFTYSEKNINRDVDSCEIWFGESHADRSYSWVFPNMHGCSVGTGVRKAKEIRNCYNIFLRRRKLDEVGKGRGYKIPLWDRDRVRMNRVLFAGDAAAQVMPMTFEGIYYAMKSAQFASRAILSRDLSLYSKLWNDRFKSRFRLMKKFQSYFLRNDKRAEQMVRMFENPYLQKASIDLWLRKDAGAEGFDKYVTLFRTFLR
jgi:geranylgeranyl reductase